MENNPIDIRELIRYFSKNVRRLVKITAVFVLLGVAVILLTRNHYTSTLKFVSQSGTNSGNLMSQLGGLSGLNLGVFEGQNSTQLSPSLYQEILYSYPFLWKLSQSKIQVSGKEVKLGAFIEEHRRPSLKTLVKQYTIGLPKKLFGEEPEPINLDLAVSDSVVFSRQELMPLFNEMMDMIILENDQNTSAISLRLETVSPEVSPQAAVHTYRLLSEYVTAYKTEKAVQNLNYIEKQFQEAKKRFYEAQVKLYNYRDRNQNLNFSAYKAEEERLQADYDLANNLYNNLALQLDQAKLKVQEDIPQLTVINPPVVSFQTSKPNIPMILAFSTFLGLMVSFAWILFLFLKNHIYRSE